MKVELTQDDLNFVRNVFGAIAINGMDEDLLATANRIHGIREAMKLAEKVEAERVSLEMEQQRIKSAEIFKESVRAEILAEGGTKKEEAN